MQFWALIVDSFREARDKKLFWVLLFISALAIGVLAAIGFNDQGLSLFFGLWTMPDPVYTAGSPAATGLMARFVTDFLVDTYIGWIGVLVCLIATAGVFPQFMERGNIDVTLSKPMSRTAIFLGKYVGSLTFVLVQAAFFVLLSFIVLRVQLGRWFWGYLWAIPLLVAQFSFVYCVCTLLAVWTRSTMASLLLTLLFWLSIPGITLADGLFSGTISLTSTTVTQPSWQERSSAAKFTHVVRAVLPKTGDVPQLVARQMGATSSMELTELLTRIARADMKEEEWDQLRREDERLAGISSMRVVGSSLLFEIVVLGIACWSFHRKDF